MSAEDEPEPPEREPEAPLAHLHVPIPYLWPRPFAAQGARMAVALGQALGWALEDPADPAGSAGARDEAAVLRSWEQGRHALLAELAEDPEAGEVRRLPADLLAAIYAANGGRHAAAAEAGPGVEVPRLVLVEVGDDRAPGALCRYTAGEAAWLPEAATHVLLARKKKGFLGYRDEEVLVPAAELRALLAPVERPGEAPAGRRSYRPAWAATAPTWGTLAGRSPKDATVIDWAGVVETDA
jgi:hypothetical protein